VRTPGFTAEDSLYRTRGHYYMSAAVAQAQGAMLQESSLLASLGVPLRGLSLPPSGRTCDQICHLDETGACVRDCTICPPGQPADGCQDFTEPCSPNACCPPGQEACYVPHRAQFCCPPGLHCCDSQTHLCCRQQCCFDAGNYCCAASEKCCGGGCCPADQVCCGGACKAVQTDVQNCGRCGNICPAPANSTASCANGRCGFACALGYTPCGNACLNLNNDPVNCGTCGNICPSPANSSASCANGRCGFTCNPGYTPCGNACLNLNSDPGNCGTCGHMCPQPLNSTATCTNGKCGFACNAGYTPCGSQCCPSGQKCNPNTGQCCPPGRDPCGKICVDLKTDPGNCGDCGHKCAAGQHCSGGTCVGAGAGGMCPLDRPVDCGDRVHCCPKDFECCYTENGVWTTCCPPGFYCDNGSCEG
jgi:hypothetical protein